jgi:hypothetical protein
VAGLGEEPCAGRELGHRAAPGEAAGRLSGQTGERELKLAERAQRDAAGCTAELSPASRWAGAAWACRGRVRGRGWGAGEVEAEAVSPRAAQALLAPC